MRHTAPIILLLLATFPAVSFAGSSKVDICHHTGDGSSHIINVSSSALPAHLAHGDNVVSEEVCDDGIDNDCDGVVDGDNAIDAPTWYADTDEDGYGDPGASTVSCTAPDGTVDNPDDCDDIDPTVNPGASEDPSTWADDDCDGVHELNLSMADAIIIGETSRDTFGSGLGSAGDVNHDGYADIVVAACEWSSNRGRAYVIPGPIYGSLAVTSVATAMFQGDASWDRVGNQVARAGDLNGDGEPDIFLGAYVDDGLGLSQNGAGYAMFGPFSGTSVLPGDADFVAWGEARYDWAGAIGNAGDVDGDGFDELLQGAWQADIGGTYSGAAYLFFGSAGLAGSISNADADIRFIPNPGDWVGNITRGVGDLDGDGLDDIAISASGYPSSAGKGAIYLFSNVAALSGDVDMESSYTARIVGEANGDMFYNVNESPGDVNGDGYADLLIGAPLNDHAAANAGAVYLFLGPFSGDYTTADAYATWYGEAAQDNLGSAQQSFADVDGDGLSEVLFGSHYYTLVREPGIAYMVDDPAPGSHSAAEATYRFTGESTVYQAGNVVNAGDLDADGLDDLLIGAPNGAYTTTGRAYILYGHNFVE